MPKFTDRLPIGARRLLTFWETIDGGPGSGNWGHKGRPGLVGGSGKGGGKQYRGGRGDIKYVGTRNDWLNGLTGEKQHEAQQWIKQLRQHFSIGEEKDKSVEQNIMEESHAGSRKMRDKLLQYMSEARGWTDNAGKLMQENLDEKDRKLVEALANKYGQAFTGGSLVPDESSTDEWDADDYHCWQDLKSKAMGGPVSGDDPPEELQYDAGLKERPKPKADFWWTKKENWGKDGFLEMVTAAQQITGNDNLQITDIDSIEKMNSLENEMFEKACEPWNTFEKGNHETELLRQYLDGKARYYLSKEETIDPNTGELRGGRFNISEFPNWAALTSTEKDTLLLYNALARNTTGEIGRAILQSNRNTKYQKKAMDALAIYAKALGADIGSTADMIDAAQARKEERIKKAKQERLDRYNNERRKNAVVIQGDSFSEKINSMRKADGNYSEDEVKAIGDVCVNELQGLLDKDKMNEELQDLLKKSGEITRRIQKLDLARDYDAADKVEKEELAPIRKKIEECSEAIKNSDAVVRNLLKRIRKTGGATKEELKAHLPGRSTVKKFVESAYESYPSEWFQMSSKLGTITTKKVSRGYCSHEADCTIGISGYSDKSMFETAVHELGHRFENSVPGIREAEKTFYDRRTDGEKTQRLRDVTGNRSYSSDEVTKVDKFISPYMGKDYSSQGEDHNYELVSMGFEMAFTNPAKLMKDRDYATWILGLLAVA